MIKVPKSKVEDRGITILQELITNNFNLKEKLKKGEKGISVDGPILVFSGDPDNKENYIGEVETQVKGSSVPISGHKSEISFQVEMGDIKNFFNYNGVIFFVVYIDWEKNINTIYYKILTPLKLKTMMELTQESHNIKLKKLADSNKLENICRELLNHQEKQVSFKPHLLSMFGDIKGLPLSFSYTFKENENIDDIVGEELDFYTKTKINGVEIEVPVIIGKMINYSPTISKVDVKIKDKVYYDSIRGILPSKIKFGSVFSFDVRTSQMDIIPCGNIDDIIKDYKFLLDLFEAKEFALNEVIIILKEINDFNKEMIEFLCNLLFNFKECVNNLGLKKEIYIDEIKEEYISQMNFLVDCVKEGKELNEDLNNCSIVYNIYEIYNLSIVFALIRNKDSKKYAIRNIFDNDFKEGFVMYATSFDGKKEIKTFNHYFMLGINVDFLLSDNVNYDMVLESFYEMEQNDDNYYFVSFLIHEMLHAYDKSKNKSILEYAYNFSNWLLEHVQNDESQIIYYSTIIRKRKLKKIEKNEIKNIIQSSKNNVDKYLCLLLLYDFSEANNTYNKLGNVDKEMLKRLPLSPFLNKMKKV